MKFFTQSIQIKIVALVVFMISLSQISNFIATYIQVRESQETSIYQSFERTNILVNTLFKSKKEKLNTQAEMLGSLPILMAVANSGDEGTIIDTATSYKSQFNLDFFDVIDAHGDFVGENQKTWSQENLDTIIEKIDQGEKPSGFIIRQGKLVLLSSAPIGFIPNHSGYVLLGNEINIDSAKQISQISNSEISFSIQESFLANTGVPQKTLLQLQKKDLDITPNFISKKIVLKNFLDNHIADLVIQSSLETSNQLFSEMVKVIITVSLLIIFLFAMLSSKMAKSISTPVKNLEALAQKIIKDMDFSLRSTPQGHDEVASLSTSFNHLLQEISESHQKLELYNKNLEIKVEERTKAINTILNNVTSGFFLVDKELNINTGFTKSCLKLVGDNFKENMKISEVLYNNKRESEHFEFCYKEIFEDFMPEVITLGQAPKKAKCNDSTLGIDASVIRDEKDQVQNILFNLTDITSLEASEAENKTNRSLLKILSKKSEFTSFIGDTKDLLKEAFSLIHNPDSASRVRIILHTIKGNCGVVGLAEQADIVHHIEDKDKIENEDLISIQESFIQFLNNHKDILKIDYNHLEKPQLLVSQDSLHELSKIHLQKEDNTSILQWIEKIKQKPANEIFAPMSDLVQRVADRVQKRVHFEIKNGDIHITPEKIAPVLQVLPHVFRNCLDHGIESASERGDKDECGQLELSIEDTEKFWNIIIKDDGKGIHTEKLVQKSLDNGSMTKEQAEKMTHEEKLRLIFADGVSTAEEVSDVSGRGVGMAAVLQAIESIGGKLLLDSVLSKGTTFTFQVPK